MIIDGTTIAAGLRTSIAREVKKIQRPVSLLVFATMKDAVTQKYLAIKQKTAESLGIQMTIEHPSMTSGTEDLLRGMLHATREYDGIVVQMPVAKPIDVDTIRQLMPITHDVDVYGTIAYEQFCKGHLPILPPVVGAINEIMKEHGIAVAGKKAVVVGEGRLVGAPSAVWMERMGALVQTINRDTPNIAESTREADILILGAGSPGLIQPDMIKEGVALFDAGTSEAEGKIAGDADPLCAEKSAFFTPVPGGVGPVAIATLFHNLVTLAKRKT